MITTCPVGQATEIFTCPTKLPAPSSPYCHTLPETSANKAKAKRPTPMPTAEKAVKDRETVHNCLWQRKKQTTNACGKERPNHKCWLHLKQKMAALIRQANS